MINTCKSNPCCGNFRDCNEGYNAANSRATDAVGRQGEGAEACDAGHLRGPVGPSQYAGHELRLELTATLANRRAREALEQQRAWVRHWIEDVGSGLTPTNDSLVSALTSLNRALETPASHPAPEHNDVREVVERVWNAVLSCPHTITGEEIVLGYSSDRPGKNAAAQLHDRISAALGKAGA